MQVIKKYSLNHNTIILAVTGGGSVLCDKDKLLFMFFAETFFSFVSKKCDIFLKNNYIQKILKKFESTKKLRKNRS